MNGAKPYKQFLQNLPAYLHNEAAPGSGGGRTWMELFIIYHMMGHSTPAPQATKDTSQASAKWSLGQSMQHFRLQVRRMVKVLCPVSQHRVLKGQARGQPLRHLGITTHLAILPITVQLTPEAETDLAARIIQSQASCSHKAATQKLRDRHWVIQHRLRTRGRTKWLTSLKKWPNELFISTSGCDAQHTPKRTNNQATNPTTTTTTAAPEQTTHVRLPDIVLLHCPTCRHAVDGTRDKFQLDKLNQRAWCKACRRQKFVRLWQCKCGIPWHTCLEHQGEPGRLRRTTQPTAANTTTTQTDQPETKYIVGSSSTQQWLRKTTARTTATNCTDIIFTRQDEAKARDMVHKRTNNNQGAPQLACPSRDGS